MSFVEAVLLGLLQGATEWLPVSSEGVVTAVYSLVFDAPLAEAVAVSLWLHLGTALSVLVVLRTDVTAIVRGALSRPVSPVPGTTFLVVATLVSAPLGLFILMTLDDVSARIGDFAMGALGALMLITGTVLLTGSAQTVRSRGDLTWIDSILTGVAQGLAALPGLSRSGLTVSSLLWRGVDRRDALALSFLLGIPASIGGGLYGAFKSEAYASPEGLVALLVAAGAGFATIRAMLALAGRVNLGWFVMIIGLGIIAGASWRHLI